MSKNIVRLKGKRINLCMRRLDEKALEFYSKWMCDQEIIRWLGRNNIVSTYTGIKEWAERKDEEGKYRFNIIEVETDRLIGNCDLTVSNKMGNAVIGIVIGEKNTHNKGYGTETIKMLVKFGFEELCLHRIALHVDADNKRAICCYKKAGFTICGTSHEVHYRDGKWIDLHEMEILVSKYFSKDYDLEKDGDMLCGSSN